jgi:hypothetical protein
VAGSIADAAVKGNALRRAGVFAGILAGPFFLVSVGLNTWASIGHLHQLGWEFVGGEQVPWPSSLARGPYGWAQIATFVITGLMIVILAVSVRDQLPQRRASGFAVVLLALLGVALILAGFPVDVPMLSGGTPATWNGWVHGIAFLLIIATGVLAPLTMALGVRGDASWRPITVMSLAADYRARSARAERAIGTAAPRDPGIPAVRDRCSSPRVGRRRLSLDCDRLRLDGEVSPASASQKASIASWPTSDFS